MAASYSQNAVIRLDRNGKTVWRYEVPGYNPILAQTTVRAERFRPHMGVQGAGFFSSNAAICTLTWKF